MTLLALAIIDRAAFVAGFAEEWREGYAGVPESRINTGDYYHANSCAPKAGGFRCVRARSGHVDARLRPAKIFFVAGRYFPAAMTFSFDCATRVR